MWWSWGGDPGSALTGPEKLAGYFLSVLTLPMQTEGVELDDFSGCCSTDALLVEFYCPLLT